MDGADCWGLYALILAREAGAPVVDLAGMDRVRPSSIRRVIADQAEQGEWVRVDGEVRQFDCVVTTIPASGVFRDAPMHVGCALGDGRMLQTSSARGPEIVQLSDVAASVWGVFRPKALA